MNQPRILFSTGSLYLLDTAQSFALAAEAGFDGIEIMCDERFGTRDPDYLRQLSDQYGLPILVAHTPFSPRLPGWRDPQNQVARIEQTLQLAETLGCRSIVVHLPHHLGYGTLNLGGRSLRFPWGTPYRSVKAWIEQTLPEVQRGTSVKIALENMPQARLYGIALDPTWRNQVEEWSAVHDWLTMDTTHWGTKGVDPLRAYRAAGTRICHIHLSNYNGEEHQLPHRGDLDLAALLKALAADDYAGTISLEVHPHVLEYQDGEKLRCNLRESLQFCREHLER